jgi:hypothetical protein
MPSSITPLANLTLGSSATSMTFSSIVGTYRDLLLVCSFINATADGDYVAVKINNDTGSNYNSVTMLGNGSAASSANYASSTLGWLTVGGGFDLTRGQLQTTFFDYAQTDKHKSFITRNGTSSRGVEAIGSRWASTSAITSLNIYSVNGWSFAAGSTFALYGVSA